MTNAAILGAILLVLAWAYRRAYMDGLLLSTFFLLLLPNTIALNLGLALPVLNAHRVILILTFVFWLRNRDLPKRILSFPFARAFLAIIAAMAVSTVLADEFLVSFKRFLYFSLETVLYYFILFSSLRDESDCRRLLEVVLYSLTAVALLGIV